MLLLSGGRSGRKMMNGWMLMNGFTGAAFEDLP